jgi:hypothetical protein
MNNKNSYGLIHIGLLIRFLRNITEHDSAILIKSAFKTLKAELQNAELNVSLSAVSSINQLRDTIKSIDSLKDEESIKADFAEKIKKEMDGIEKIVYSEAITKRIYQIPERRYNGNYLLNEPSKLLKTDTYSKLSDIAKFDFNASCRCLAFGEGTACAFHILRATEDSLKQMYYHYKKTKRLAIPMWGPMTIELRNKKHPKPNESILNALDVIRVSYRNPTQHPEVTYDIDGAQDLFGLCIDIINKMIATI